MRKISLYMLFCFFVLSSCGKTKIEGLERENEQLKYRIKSLEDINEGLMEENQVKNRKMEEMIIDFHDILLHASNASSNASSASFWYGNSEFHFRNSIDDMEDDFNAIVSIASKY